MRFAHLPVFVFLFLLSGASTFAQSAPSAVPGANAVIRGTYGDWQMRCENVQGTVGEQCALVQSVIAKDRANTGLMVIAGKFGAEKVQMLRVITPLGVLLPAGLGLHIDGENIGATDFVHCVPNGCIAEAKLDDALVKKLKSGKTANFQIFLTREDGIGIPVSLNGFATGFDLLK